MTCSEIIEYTQHLGQREYIYLGLAALALTFFLILLLRRQPKKFVAYKTDDGKVYVARSAVKELVQSACEQLEGVTKPKTKIRIKRGRANFDVQVKLVGNSRLREVESTLQKQMREALTENLGIEKLGAINVTATGFKIGRLDKGQTKLSQKAKVEEDTVEPEMEEVISDDVTDPEDDQRLS